MGWRGLSEAKVEKVRDWLKVEVRSVWGLGITFDCKQFQGKQVQGKKYHRLTFEGLCSTRDNLTQNPMAMTYGKFT